MHESVTPASWRDLATIVGVIVSIVALTIQIWRSRAARHVDLILDFEKRFESEEMKRKRSQAASFLALRRPFDPSDDSWRQVRWGF
jgi:hypothetical protein